MWTNLDDITKLNEQIINNYIFALVVAIALAIICILIINAIKFEGGLNPKDRIKRKIWFYTLGIIGSLSFWGFHFFYVTTKITLPVIKSKLMLHYLIATGVVFVLYFVFIFLLAKIFKKAKVGGIFPSK